MERPDLATDAGTCAGVPRPLHAKPAPVPFARREARRGRGRARHRPAGASGPVLAPGPPYRGNAFDGGRDEAVELTRRSGSELVEERPGGGKSGVRIEEAVDVALPGDPDATTVGHLACGLVHEVVGVLELPDEEERWRPDPRERVPCVPPPVEPRLRPPDHRLDEPLPAGPSVPLRHCRDPLLELGARWRRRDDPSARDSQ